MGLRVNKVSYEVVSPPLLLLNLGQSLTYILVLPSLSTFSTLSVLPLWFTLLCSHLTLCFFRLSFPSVSTTPPLTQLLLPTWQQWEQWSHRVLDVTPDPSPSFNQKGKTGLGGFPKTICLWKPSQATFLWRISDVKSRTYFLQR